MRLLFFILAFSLSSAQTPQLDMSRGAYLISQRPFEYEAWVFALRFDDVTNTTSKVHFDLETYKSSNYTSFLAPVIPSSEFPAGTYGIPFSKLVEDDGNGNYPLGTLETTNFNNIVKVQFEDDNVNPLNPTIVAEAKTWFDAKRLDSDYDDIILSIDPAFAGFGIDTEVFKMINDIQPDLIMFNDYPWKYSTTLHFRQTEYGFYARLIYWNRYAQLGLNQTSEKPIPFGAFTQSTYQGLIKKMPLSYMKYNNFLSLAFGAKYLASFLYNSAKIWGTGAQPSEPGLPVIISGQESILFDVEFPFAKATEFKIQNEIIRQCKNLGNALKFLNPTGQRLIRATNIEAPVQSAGFAGGVYEWNYGTRPDVLLTDITVTRPNVATTQDVWVGYFNPLHSTFDSSGTTDEDYFMIVNGCWDNNAVTNIQNIRLNFDFGGDDTINSLLKLNRNTGQVLVVPLTNITGNTYYLDLILDGGEGDLFKYNNGVGFVNDIQIQQPLSSAVNNTKIGTGSGVSYIGNSKAN